MNISLIIETCYQNILKQAFDPKVPHLPGAMKECIEAAVVEALEAQQQEFDQELRSWQQARRDRLFHDLRAQSNPQAARSAETIINRAEAAAEAAVQKSVT